VIGWMSDIEHWKMEDLKKHFDKGYAPNNSVMVIAGDITASQVIQLAERYLEAIKPRELPPRVTTSEPEQQGERRVSVVKFAQLPLLEIAYHVPQTAPADSYPLQ